MQVIPMAMTVRMAGMEVRVNADRPGMAEKVDGAEIVIRHFFGLKAELGAMAAMEGPEEMPRRPVRVAMEAMAGMAILRGTKA